MIAALRRAAGLIVLLQASAAAASGPESESSARPPADAARSTDEIVQLHVTGAGYGMLTGLWVRELSGTDSKWSLALPIAAGGALGVGGTVWLDRSQDLPLGLPQAIVTDTFIGFEIASAWVWHFRVVDGRRDWSAATETSLLWGGATLGAGLGVLRYALSPSPPGQAAFTGSVTLWSGTFSGLLAGALTSDGPTRDDNASMAAAIGLEAGVVLGSYAGRLLKPSLGWVRALDAGALLGGALSGGIYLAVTGRSYEPRTALALGAAGVGTGLVAAALFAPKLGLPRAAQYAVVPDLSIDRGGGVAVHGSF